jgi:hypothetical protein
MNVQISCSPRYPINRWALRAQDVLMVSAFGIWSVVLGLSPILIFHALAS